MHGQVPQGMMRACCASSECIYNRAWIKTPEMSEYCLIFWADTVSEIGVMRLPEEKATDNHEGQALEGHTLLQIHGHRTILKTAPLATDVDIDNDTSVRRYIQARNQDSTPQLLDRWDVIGVIRMISPW